MSSEGSISSRFSQFGLYRTIDARTEEFLKLSKKRQMRQGCVCAAISTAVTVTVVVIVLLIYEYMIVVETTFVQNRRSLKRNKTILLNDQPIADRLDRSYFGFDQDYYERMPLLVNALQENSYLDPSSEMFEISNKKRRFPNARNIKLTTEHYRAIRRTSPRPFLYEYKNPVPAPFSKTHSKSHTSRSWVESYRNAQRLKNLNEILKYLEQTVNAKFGDLKTQTNTRIAFSGIYVKPYSDEHKNSGEHDLTALGSYKQVYKSNHLFDPLYTFKPDHPGEINLLAEGLRFAPTPSLHFVSEIPTVPIFRPKPNRKNNCLEHLCKDNEKGNVKIPASSSRENTDPNDMNTLKSFGVMLNLYPIHKDKSTEVVSTSIKPSTEVDKIYITTARPKFQFQRKTSFPVRRTSVRGRPRFSSKIKHSKNNISKSRDNLRQSDVESTTMPKMIVHVNVYSVNKAMEKTKNITETLISNTYTETTPFSTTSTHKPIVDNYPILNSSHVEDYHVGSSGVIPLEERTVSPPTLPIITPIVPLFDTTTLNYEAQRTDPPDVIKFSPEDAKIPEVYLNVRKSDGTPPSVTEMTRRFEDPVEIEEKDIEARTLVVKLKNYDTSSEESNTELAEEVKEVTQTYVPQMNGHYRNLIHKSLTTLLRENSEKYRRKLENSISAIRKSTYVPMYVEIRRNHTSSQIDD